jgi:hypothetical protein
MDILSMLSMTISGFAAGSMLKEARYMKRYHLVRKRKEPDIDKRIEQQVKNINESIFFFEQQSEADKKVEVAEFVGSYGDCYSTEEKNAAYSIMIDFLKQNPIKCHEKIKATTR